MDDLEIMERVIQDNLTASSEARKQQIQDITNNIREVQLKLQNLQQTRVNIHKKKHLQRELEVLQTKKFNIESGRTEHLECRRSQQFLSSIRKKHMNQAKKVRKQSRTPHKQVNEAGDTRYVDNPLNKNIRKQKLRKNVRMGTNNGTSKMGNDSIMDEFTNTKSSPANSVYVLPYFKCDVCDVHMHKLLDASVMVCPTCGSSYKYLDSSRTGLGYNDDIEIVCVSYKRENHFKDWLNTVQGRECTVIPDTVIEEIMAELYRSGVRDKTAITRKMIETILTKNKKMRRYKKYLTTIFSKVTGIPPIQISPQDENKLKIMFNSIQKPFNRHRPNNRKNFLSYSYVLFKFCELLGLDEFREYFKLLKGRDKLYKQDRIWEPICKDLEWEFIPSI